MSAVSWQQTALCMLGGAGLAGFMMWTWHMAVMARVYVSDRLSARRAYVEERGSHLDTQRTLREFERRLSDIEALCGDFGYRPSEGTLRDWLDQRFAAHRDELRRLRPDASLRPDGSPRPNVQRSERHSGPALRAHLAEQDNKDKPS